MRHILGDVSVVTPLPKALGKTPLLEAIFELRFRPTVPSAGDLLPGLLFRDFRAEYPSVEQLPVGTIPRELREKQPDLLYQPTHRLVGSTRAIQVGERVVSLAMLYPYPGWTTFRDGILRLLRSIRGTELVHSCERFSFRYLNVLATTPGAPQLPMLAVHLSWPGHVLTERGLRLRFEYDEGDFTTVVQVTSDVNAKRGDSVVSGLLVDVDTVRPMVPLAFIMGEEEGALLDRAHSVVKYNFYSLLTNATLEGLEPIYDGAVV